MPNLLTAEAGLKLGPIAIETFFKYYLERNSQTNGALGSECGDSLRQQDPLWQESFEIVKSFLNLATKHTVEELQELSNAHIPVPPWVSVKRVLVPMTVCDAAADHLIKALGGENITRRVVGGTKWWQVRGLRGVDCEWIWQKSSASTSQRRGKAKGHKAQKDEISPILHSSSRFPTFRKFTDCWRGAPLDKANGAKKKSGDADKNEILNDCKAKEASHDSFAGLDGTRCILYAHGGGYYFGSVDQERYCMQRFARKISGRVFALNYRLAPQYPFPCAIQDMLAAYLYLIEPPPDAMHAPVAPNLVVFGGDSAGGGLCLATLQVIRDCGMPLPAGAVLISPWCDLTHSFPSTSQNTETDIIPPYGLCLHKPSMLWPPPSDELTSVVRVNLQERFKEIARRVVEPEGHAPPDEKLSLPQIATLDVENNERDQAPKYSRMVEKATRHISLTLFGSKATDAIHVQPDIPNSAGSRTPRTISLAEPRAKHITTEPSLITDRPPLPWEPSDSFNLAMDGDAVTIDTQLQLYCPNSLLVHPLVSPALGHLGGLPPLLVIASDKEVLRDEIIYLAHKAAHPDRFPFSEDSKALYPPRPQPTQDQPTLVHLQIYDETAHVLPLFAFTTPAKYCYRAIASFIKHLTPTIEPSVSDISNARQFVTPRSQQAVEPLPEDDSQLQNIHDSVFDRGQSFFPSGTQWERLPPSFMQRNVSTVEPPQPSDNSQPLITDVKGADFKDITGMKLQTDESQPQKPDTAGDPSVYTDARWPLGVLMIRERVSIRGVLRPLEPEIELPALNLPPSHIGRINLAAARRYLTGRDIWAKKFNKTARKIETRRKKNMELAKRETIHVVENMLPNSDAWETRGDYQKKALKSMLPLSKRAKKSVRFESEAERLSWIWSRTLDGEHPPPSSIVSWRHTADARDLARVAALSVEPEESNLSGNMLLSVLVKFLATHSVRKLRESQGNRNGHDGARNRSDERAAVDSVKGLQILERFRSLDCRQPE